MNLRAGLGFGSLTALAVWLAVAGLVGCAKVDKQRLGESPGNVDDARIGEQQVGEVADGGGDEDDDGPIAGSEGNDDAPDAAVGCMATPDNEFCAEVCPESCNGVDDDCDDEIDEDADRACAAPNSASLCIGGRCLLTDCDQGYRDCDNLQDNGCEADLGSVDHCGACGNVCEFENAIAACVDGQCVPMGCLDTFLDCDGSPEVCETAGDSLLNCGACGQVCGGIQNATAECRDRQCALDECVGNFGDCNGLLEDGCELELNEPNNCAGCNMGCAFAGSIASCATGVCLATDCGPSYKNCDGDATNGCESLNDAANCGDCGVVCTVESLDNVASAQCQDTTCVSQCLPLFDDCDGQPNGCETPLTTVSNCGACGDTCGPANAMGSCDDGICGIGGCLEGWADCDGDTDNGCEANLADPTTCGSCEQQCGQDIGCSDGVCAGITCSGDLADCDGVESCDYDLSDDATCGACNVSCPFEQGVVGNAGVSCEPQTGGDVAFACELACDDGFEDCDGDHRNGCEVDLTSLDNCDACGKVCSKQHATATCENRICQVDVCDQDWGDCDGDDLSCESQLNTTTHCGSCGNDCIYAGAEASCVGDAGARSCTLTTCNPSFYANCDSETANGCEVDTRSDPLNCDGCGNNCNGEPNVQAASCSDSSCVFDSCKDGFGDCNSGPGCESSLGDTANCGTCGNDCGELPNIATAICNTGAGTPYCEVATCLSGYGDCNGELGCETNVLTDSGHCGGCAGQPGNEPCEDLPNVYASTCLDGGCLIATCNTGFEDCNNDASDGCEWEPAQDGMCCDASADTDSDGFDDCADECPLDSGRAVAGECGCPSSPAASDQACNDGLCIANVLCDGAGTCGDPGDCAPPGTCTFRSYAGMASSGYWFCTDGQNWNNALTNCRAIDGGDLIQVDDATEDAFANQYRVGYTWLGGTDAQTEDTWVWSRSGAQFWQGRGTGGSVVDGLYNNFQVNEPNGDSDCTHIWQANGEWADGSCANVWPYICEVGPDLCPDNPKLTPGVCGCAEPDVDTDMDGVLDCNDECPMDAETAIEGQCGCPSSPTMVGASCDDGLCEAATMCDGAGHCGELSECVQSATIATGREHACAISDGGRVICWGTNDYGELGNGDVEANLRGGRHVKDLYDVVQIAAGSGGNHTCALRAGGQVLCWGSNGTGRLGDGTTTNRKEPVSIGINDAIQVSAGNNFSCAILQSGEVRCWGAGAQGRLGHGSTGNSYTPTAVLAGETGSGNLQGAVFISCGNQHACAVLSNGRVVCWGEDSRGRLGNGSDTGDELTPVYVHGIDDAGTCTQSDQSGCLANAVMVEAGEDTTLVVHAAGLVSSFGEDNFGENGQGTGTTNSEFPRRVTNVGGGGTLDDAQWVSMGQHHGCAVRQNGEAVCWGEDANGRLGDNAASSGDQHSPVIVFGATDYAQVAAGSLFTCGHRSDGTVSCWGYSSEGQLGYGDTQERKAPTPMAGPPDGFVEIDGGRVVGCGVSPSGAVYCWGEGNNGEIGQGSTRAYHAPARVIGIDNASDVGVGYDSVCALLDDGGIKCWGYGANGRLGDGTQTQRTTPVDVLSTPDGSRFTGAVQISAGWFHTCILRDDSTVWCWGYNPYGALGDLTTTQRLVPVQVSGIDDATAVGSGHYHTCAVRGSAGEVWCWGLDDLGQLGINIAGGSEKTPQRVQGPETGFAGGRQVIVGGRGNTCAVKQDGTVWCWGYGALGTTGDGNTSASDPAPVKIASAYTDFVRVAANSMHTSANCALRAGGEMLCWGYNDQGEMGNETTGGTYSTPAPVHFAEAAVRWGNTDMLSPVVDIAVGNDFTMAVHQNGSATSWGLGSSGQLGSGYIPNWNFPTEICAPVR